MLWADLDGNEIFKLHIHAAYLLIYSLYRFIFKFAPETP